MHHDSMRAMNEIPLIDKQHIHRLIVEQLQADLQILEQAVEIARDTATHADCLGASKYETMGLEASYLAQGQGVRLLQVERTLNYFKDISVAEAGDRAGLSSLLLLEDDDGALQLLWLAAEGGGLQVFYEGAPVTLITPQAPLGRALLGKAIDDDVEISIATKQRNYTILALY